ncbi:uri1, prefoldin-like chaperone [Coemansia sp. RSA 2673]|nr:uri1, prefoldin-like chaperone [Coemansia sp. RSA 2673]
MSIPNDSLSDQKLGGGDVYQKYYDRDVSSIQSAIDQYVEYKTEYHNLQTTLLELPDELEYDAMVPVGPLAFFPGKLIHTNEILVSLGDNWFTERSAKQAADIARRREEYVDEKIRVCRRDLKEFSERKKLVPEIFADEKEQVEKAMFNEDGEEIVDIKEELDAEQVPDFHDQTDGAEPVLTKSAKEELEAKRARVIQSLSSPAAESKVKQALGAEEQRIMDMLDQFNSDDEDLDEDASEDEEHSGDNDEDGDAFSDEDRANAAQDDDEDDYNDHSLRQRPSQRHRSNSDDEDNDIDGDTKLNVVERYRSPVTSSPSPHMDDGHKGILKKSTPVSLFKKQRADEVAGSGNGSPKSVSFNTTAVAYTQPSQDLLDESNVDEDISRVTNLISMIGMSGQDKAKSTPKIAIIDEIPAVAASSKQGSAVPVVGKFKPNVSKAGVRSRDTGDSSSTAKPKAPKAQQPMKSAVIERSALPSDTNQDIVDEDMHAREIAQVYNRMRLSKLASGNLNEAADIAERILADTPGVTLIESKAPKDDDDGDEGAMDVDGYERIELPEEPSSFGLSSVSQRPPEVVHQPRLPPPAPVAVQNAEPQPQPQQPAKPKMSRFKAQRLGLED